MTKTVVRIYGLIVVRRRVFVSGGRVHVPREENPDARVVRPYIALLHVLIRLTRQVYYKYFPPVCDGRRCPGMAKV